MCCPDIEINILGQIFIFYCSLSSTAKNKYTMNDK